MDFVVELLESSGYDTVITVVYSISKRAHFILIYTTVTAENIVRLFLYHVWNLHSLSDCVVSDRGLQFIILLTKKLYCLLGITSSMTWHP